MKIIINICYGGFGFSKEAIIRMRELGYERANNISISQEEHDKKYPTSTISFHNWDNFSFYDNESGDERTDPLIIQVVEELGERASGSMAKLKIVEIPDNIKYIIEEYDGTEWIAEEHKTWS